MARIIIFVVGCLILCASASSEEQFRNLKGGGHLLGETAGQFFSEGFAAEMQQACQGKDWKAVRQLSKKMAQASKASPKDVCMSEKLAEQQASTGARLDYSDRGDAQAMRTDSFTFEGGILVRIHLVYSVPIANIEGYNPKSFSELYAGLQEAYGPPSKSYSEPVLDVYGVRYEARHAVWLGKQDVISIIEHPGKEVRTEIIAETVSEYERAAQAPKNKNPLQ
jgi:hypothetical protein